MSLNPHRRIGDTASMDWSVVVLAAAMLVVLFPNIRVVREGERLVVFRLGRFHRILSPGLNLIVWGIDMPHYVKLNDVIPDWHGMSEEDLDSRLRHLAVTGQFSR